MIMRPNGTRNNDSLCWRGKIATYQTDRPTAYSYIHKLYTYAYS
jgi:hypothetical protein